jgi:hypothetical protein
MQAPGTQMRLDMQISTVISASKRKQSASRLPVSTSVLLIVIFSLAGWTATVLPVLAILRVI